MKPYWFKLTENDEPSFIKPKNHRFLILLIGITIGFMGSYFLIPQKVADTPVDQISIVEPTNPQPSIKNTMLNPSGDEDDFDEDDD